MVPILDLIVIISFILMDQMKSQIEKIEDNSHGAERYGNREAHVGYSDQVMDRGDVTVM